MKGFILAISTVALLSVCFANPHAHTRQLQGREARQLGQLMHMPDQLIGTAADGAGAVLNMAGGLADIPTGLVGGVGDTMMGMGGPMAIPGMFLSGAGHMANAGAKTGLGAAGGLVNGARMVGK